MIVLGLIRLVSRSIRLALPFGKLRLAWVLVLSVLFGVTQVIGVTSIFPFFALASDPAGFRASRLGQALLAHLPTMSDHQLLIAAGIASIGMLVLMNGLSLLNDITRLRYGHDLTHDLRARMVRSIMAQPYAYFLERNTGAMIQRLLGDVGTYIQGVFLPILECFSRMLAFGLLLITVFVVQPWLALLAGVFLGLFYGLTFFGLRRRSQAIGDGLKAVNQRAQVVAIQLLSAAKPIKVHGKEAHFTAEYCACSAQQSRLVPMITLLSTVPRYALEPIVYGGMVGTVLIYLLTGRSFAEILPTLTLLALAGYRMMPSAQIMFTLLNQIYSIRYLLDEVEDEMARHPVGAPALATAPEPPVAPLVFNQAIRLEGLTFQYPRAKAPVLEGFSLTIPKNQAVGIVGETGSGKSTLVDVILGLHTPQSGQIWVDDIVLTPERLPAWRNLIGYVPQDIYLIDDTIAANIAFGVPPKAVDQARLREVCQTAQILDFIERDLPQGLATTVGERGVRLSGGQRQRLGLARALYHRPELLVLDEATSALDHETETAVMDAIRQLQGRITMVIIAHRLSTLETCDHVVRLGRRP